MQQQELSQNKKHLKLIFKVFEQFDILSVGTEHSSYNHASRNSFLYVTILSFSPITNPNYYLNHLHIVLGKWDQCVCRCEVICQMELTYQVIGWLKSPDISLPSCKEEMEESQRCCSKNSRDD